MSQQNDTINEFHESKQKAKPRNLWWIVLFGLLPTAKEQTKFCKKMQGKLIIMKEELEYLNELLKFLQLSLESAPGVLEKEKTISSMTGSLLEAFCLWDELSIKRNTIAVQFSWMQ
jgi:hypothetical protein